MPYSRLKPYVIAVLAVTSALFLKLFLDRWIGIDTPFLLFFGAVMLSAYYGGKRAGLFATVLAIVLAEYFFLAPIYPFFSISKFFKVGFFWLEAVTITNAITALSTARSRAEGIAQKLKESEEQFSLFMDNLPGIAFIKSREGHHLYFNKTAKEVFHWTSDEWYGKTNEQLFGEAVAEQFNHHDQLVIQEQKKLVTVESIPQKNGIHHYIINKFPIFNNHQYPVMLGGIAIDVTERLQVEQALKDSELKFRSIFEQAALGILLADTKGNIIQTNAALEKIIGYTQAELSIIKIAEITHPDDIAKDWELYQELLANKRDSYQLEKRYFHKNGQLVWGRLNVSHISDSEGVPQFAIAMLEDITKQKETESALHNALQKLNFHVENSPLAVIEWDANFRVIRWSKAAQNIFGWSSEEVLNKHLNEWNFIFADDALTVKSLIARLCEGVEQRNISYNRNYKKDSSVIYCEWYNSALIDESGKLLSVLSLILDVTERKCAELAAIKSAERTSRLQTVTASLSAALTPYQVAQVIVEQAALALGAARGVVTLLSDNKTELEVVSHIGYPEAVVEAWHRFPINTKVPLADAVFTKQPVLLESNYLKASRYPELPLLEDSFNSGALAAIPLIVEERVLGSLGLGFSETRNFNTEDCAFMLALASQCAQAIQRAQLYKAAQNQTQELAKANRMKDEFLGVLSHELRTPLNSILNWAKLLRTRKFDEATAKKALEIIERNALIQAQLVEDILDVSKIIQGKLRIQPRPINLLLTIEAAIDTMLIAAEQKKIQIKTNLSPFIGLVCGDPQRLQQVIWNLLSNAIKFTPAKGLVHVQFERVEDFAVITVSDTGKGISADFLPYVFDRFSQADSSSTRSHSGLGLGLAIVQHLVELHGGTISAQSDGENKGATFKLRLPLLQSNSEKPLATSHQQLTTNN